MSASSAASARERTTSRWLQLFFGFVAMMSISSPQYVWTVFVEPFRQSFGADTTLAALQFTPSLLIILQTFFSPFQAYLVERFGPRALISLGALMSGLCWVLSSQATSVYMLYVTYGIIGGFGTGIVYVGIIGLMVRWFPDRRGLATGVAAAGYGFGAFFTSIPITGMVASSGHVRTLVVWGIAQAVVGIVAALNLRTPPEAYLPPSYDPEIARTELQSRRSYTTREMLGNPIFYLLFVMMTMMSTGGLMVVLNVAPFANEYGVAKTVVGNFPIFGAVTALGLSLTLSRVTNGLTRPFFGWVSDHIGRENTMALAFYLEGAAILVLFYFLDNPLMFVLLTGVVFFGWGEIFSLFPSTLTDTFGPKYAATNYGFLYIAQGVGSVLGGPAAAFLRQTTGTWTLVFAIITVLDVVTATLAITVLKRLRQQHLERS
jgi:MFS transporter, OFA family, oxalate/formate antiporter